MADVRDQYRARIEVELRYQPDEKVEHIRDHAILVLQVARNDCEIHHPTTYLDIAEATFAAAHDTLERRRGSAYAIHRAGKFDPLLLDGLRRRVDLIAVIGKEVKLRVGWGGKASGPCPFHEDRSPSFHIWPDHYYCFGCGAYGDVFDWVEHTQNVSFPMAVRYIAGLLGISIEE